MPLEQSNTRRKIASPLGPCRRVQECPNNDAPLKAVRIFSHLQALPVGVTRSSVGRIGQRNRIPVPLTIRLLQKIFYSRQWGSLL